jgi:hypothetical protein
VLGKNMMVRLLEQFCVLTSWVFGTARWLEQKLKIPCWQMAYFAPNNSKDNIIFIRNTILADFCFYLR